MRMFLIVCLGISLGGCGEEESVFQEKIGKNVDSLQQPGPETGGSRGRGEETGREEVARNEQEKFVEPINVDSRSHPRQTFNDSGGTYVLAFSPNGQRLASGGGNGIVKIREVATGRVINEFDMRTTHSVTCVGFSRTARRWLQQVNIRSVERSRFGIQIRATRERLWHAWMQSIPWPSRTTAAC
jgi:hypothetical protein